MARPFRLFRRLGELDQFIEDLRVADPRLSTELPPRSRIRLRAASTIASVIGASKRLAPARELGTRFVRGSLNQTRERSCGSTKNKGSLAHRRIRRARAGSRRGGRVIDQGPPVRHQVRPIVAQPNRQELVDQVRPLGISMQPVASTIPRPISSGLSFAVGSPGRTSPV